ncbi:hypothetical protein ACFFMR_29260 [Micromonospora andamanensis]|uniref:Uncharacterized protein n=1 Tax=Micromonospora andamanensis TaxID=1287068 RepID=A0ABQ4HS24_9ACTN|nr:hypothetical protein [Micromonospora andamanensis]GIJ08422.1 hypothetical protein Van01_16360 [Micromonospora andamanensis]
MVLDPRTRGAVTRALINVEAAHERRGWDLPSTLLGVFDVPLSAQRQSVHVDAGLIDPNVWHNPFFAHGDPTLPPGVILHSLADLLAHPSARPQLREWLNLGGRRCVAFALVFEAWAAAMPPGYRHGDLATASPAARIETRLVAAVDIDGQLHQIKRVRGEQQATVSEPSQPPPGRPSSRIANGLERLMDLARTL